MSMTLGECVRRGWMSTQKTSYASAAISMTVAILMLDSRMYRKMNIIISMPALIPTHPV